MASLGLSLLFEYVHSLVRILQVYSLLTYVIIGFSCCLMLRAYLHDLLYICYTEKQSTET